MPSSNSTAEMPVALAIATSDSGCGAGIQADTLTFAAQNVFATNIFCCLTAQNPDGVTSIEELPTAFIEAQWKQIRSYFHLGAIKTGMLFSTPVIEQVASIFEECPEVPKVVDPVMVAASGAVLLQDEAVEAMRTLFPLATLITPNLDEMGVLLGRRPHNLETMKEAGAEAASQFGTAILVKGGHLETRVIQDVLVLPDGSFHSFEAQFNPAINTHGSGCTLASAIAAGLAKNYSLEEGVALGHAYLQKTLAEPLLVSDERFISHGFR